MWIWPPWPLESHGGGHQGTRHGSTKASDGHWDVLEEMVTRGVESPRTIDRSRCGGSLAAQEKAAAALGTALCADLCRALEADTVEAVEALRGFGHAVVVPLWCPGCHLVGTQSSTHCYHRMEASATHPKRGLKLCQGAMKRARGADLPKRLVAQKRLCELQRHGEAAMLLRSCWFLPVFSKQLHLMGFNHSTNRGK